MNFNVALEGIQNKKLAFRDTWRREDGKTSFIYLVNGSEFIVNRAPLHEIYPEGTKIKYRPHIDITDIDGTCGTWTPANEDLLANDWHVADKAE